MKKLILSAIFCLLINNVIASTSDNFSWESATVYFVITDRFCNGDTTNDVNYGRSVDYGTEQLPHASYTTFHSKISNRLISPNGLERLIASDFSEPNPFRAEDFCSIIIETRL